MTEPTTAARHEVSWWRDDYGEWVWTCCCSPDVHGGYAAEARAIREAAAHVDAD